MVIPHVYGGRNRPFDSGVGEDPGRMYWVVSRIDTGISGQGCAGFKNIEQNDPAVVAFSRTGWKSRPKIPIAQEAGLAADDTPDEEVIQ